MPARSATRRRHSPRSTSAVPSPPSATGTSSTSRPPARRPARQRQRRLHRRQGSLAASRRGERAHGPAPRRGRPPSSSRSRDLRLLRARHPLQHRERKPLAGQEDQADPDADRHLDCLEPDPERKSLRIVHAVGDERQGDRGLHETDVPGPERKEHRHVHQHQHEPGRGQRRVDVERAHRRPDREQLTGPAGALK